MISVLLLGSHTATGQPPTSGEAVRTLSALVPGVVEGVLRDVQLIATASEPDLASVADHAGCAYVAADLSQALPRAAAAARSPYLFVVLAGVSFDRALTDEMGGLGGRHESWLADGIGLKAMETGALGRLLPRLAPTVGILTTRDQLLSKTAPTIPSLWRKLRPRRLFKTRAWSGGG